MNPAYTPTNRTESQIELNNTLFIIKRAIESLQTSEYLPESLYGKRVLKKLIMDLTSTSAYIMDVSENFKTN